MSNIVVIEIQNTLLHKDAETHIKDVSLFFERFLDRAILIMFENTIHNEDILPLIMNQKITDDIRLNVYGLNNIAKSRLINNFEKFNPELSFIIIGCGDDSKMMKIWRKDAS